MGGQFAIILIMILGKDNIERLPPPIGTSDWARFSRTSYCVDKTLILKDLIDSDSTVVLFTRPRRFGKTTMMRMIAEFYDGDATLFADADLKALARAAREQIDGRQYDATFRAEGIADIEKIGLAYCKNKVEICR